MDSCEYPVDAAGKRIPLDTRVLYDDQGVAHAINYFLYATHSMDPEGHWMVTTGEGKRIQAHYLYLTAPDSLGKLIDDIEKCARTGNSCRYFSPTGNCRDCAIRSGSDYNCERAIFSALARRLHELTGGDGNVGA